MPTLSSLFDSIRARAGFAVARANAQADYELIFDLVRARKAAGLKQKDVAAMLGVSQQAVSKIEDYEGDPRLSTLRTYANAIGVLVSHDVQPAARELEAGERWVSQKVYFAVRESPAETPVSFRPASVRRADFAMAA